MREPMRSLRQHRVVSDNQLELADGSPPSTGLASLSFCIAAPTARLEVQRAGTVLPGRTGSSAKPNPPGDQLTAGYETSVSSGWQWHTGWLFQRKQWREGNLLLREKNLQKAAAFVRCRHQRAGYQQA